MSLLFASLAAVSFAPVTATLSPDGSVRLAQEGQTLAALSPMVARAGWTFIGFVPDGGSGGLSATVPGGRIVGKASLTKGPGGFADGVEYAFEATPDVDVAIETSGLSLTTSADWAGGKYSTSYLPFGTGGSDAIKTGEIPATYKELHFLTDKIGSFTLEQGNRKLGLAMLEQSNVLFQDSRGFGSGFDFRIGIPNGAETWPKGQTRRYRVVLSTGGPMQVLQSKPLTISEGPDWIPLEAHLDVEKGSALDWAPKRLEPAGSKGWIRARNGHFVFEKDPTKPVRFYGANLAFSAAVPDKPVADALAERLMRLGYNTMRLHHFDMILSNGTTEAQSDPMDRMDYLVAALKKRGIYTTLDFYTIRQIAKDAVVPGNVGMDEYKGLLLVSEKARENWWQFVRSILEHKNPYTGLKWKDDPAIGWLVVVNENTVGNSFRAAGPEAKKLFNQAWQAAGHAGDYTFDTDEGARFGMRLHRQAYDWMKAKIRGIGAKALLSDVNGWAEQQALILHRETLDYVDNHDYWDHPSFLSGEWGLPSRGWSGGGMAFMANAGGLANKSLSRVKGLPFTISEFNFTAPNRYRSEGGLVIGSLAARQDWDAMWRFAWSHNQDNIKAPSPMAYFDIQADPMMLASERAIISLFLRRDMPIARAEKVVRIGPATASAKGYSTPVTKQLFDVRLSTSTKEGDPNGAEVPLPKMLSPYRVDAQNGVLIVDTPKTAGLFAPIGIEASAGPLSATLTGHRGAVWVSSLDDKPIRESRRLLLTHLTDAQNTGVTFAAEDRDVLTAWGSQPWLLRNGAAVVRLGLAEPSRASVYRLDMAGNRVEKLPTKSLGTEMEFEATVKGPKGGTMYYEIVR